MSANLFELIKNTFQSKQHKALQDEVAEFHALKREIDKARCVVEYSPQGDILTVNQNWLDALGYQSHEMVGHHHYDFLTQEERKSPQAQDLWNKLSRGENDTGQYRFVAKNGEIHWFQGYFSPIPNAKGEIYKVTSYMTDITKDKQKSADSEGQIAAISKSQCVVELTMDGKIISANQNFLDIFGYTANELVGQSDSLLMSASQRDSKEYLDFWASLNRGEYQAGQYKHISKRGVDVWMQASYNPIVDIYGKPVKVVKYATDITAQKIRDNDYLGQINAIKKAQGVIEVALDGTILYANDVYLDMLGYTLEELAGRHVSVVLDPSFAKSEAYKVFWQKLVNGGSDVGQYKRIAKNGKEVWIQASYSPILDLNGKPFKLVNYTIDITEQKLQAANNASQIDAVNKIQGVIEFDLKGNILAMNENFAKVTGYSEKEVVGKHHSIFVEPDYKASQEYKEFWLNLAKGESNAGRFKRISKSGDVVWLQAFYAPILDLNGQPYRVIKFATDITEQHNNAQALSDAVEETQAIIEDAKAGDLSSRVPLAGKTGAIASLCDGVNALM
ncbi:MAG: PAS domain-containing protein, partial [Methylotenera sp.]|nr:PAS domain-containing protein [Methylotenera sp.]